MIMIRAFPVLVAAMFVISGCSWPAKPVVLPDASTIETAAVTWGTMGEHTQDIHDRRNLEAFVAFVNARDDGWHKPWGTFPTVEYTILLKERDGDRHPVWLGADWMGGREANTASSSNRLRRLSHSERAECLRVLGLSEE